MICKRNAVSVRALRGAYDPGSDQVSLDLILDDQGTLYHYDCIGFRQIGSVNAQSAPPEEDTSGIFSQSTLLV